MSKQQCPDREGGAASHKMLAPTDLISGYNRENKMGYFCPIGGEDAG